MNKSLYFDLIRVIAMIAVIGVHLVGSLAPEIPSAKIDSIMLVILNDFNSLGVLIFCALSGYFVLCKNEIIVKSYYNKKIIRIIIPYLVYALFYTIILTGFENHNLLGVFWGKDSYIIRLFTARVHGTHWFVYAISIFYFFAPYLNRGIRNLEKSDAKIFLIGIVFIRIIVLFNKWNINKFKLENIILDQNIDYFTWFLNILLLFTVGYYANNILKKYLNVILKRIFLIICFALYCLKILCMEYLVILFMFIEYDIKISPKMNKVICALARRSYSIYLIHAAVLSVYLRLFNNIVTCGWLKVIVGYIFVILVCYILSCKIDSMIVQPIQDKVKVWLK